MLKKIQVLLFLLKFLFLKKTIFLLRGSSIYKTARARKQKKELIN